MITACDDMMLDGVKVMEVSPCSFVNLSGASTVPAVGGSTLNVMDTGYVMGVLLLLKSKAVMVKSVCLCEVVEMTGVKVMSPGAGFLALKVSGSPSDV